MFKKNFISSVRLNAYADGDGGTVEPPVAPPVEPVAPPVAPVAPPVAPVPPSGESFDQDQVNAILKKDREKHQAQTQRAVEELDLLKSKAQITADERESLETTISQLKNDMLTKEQRMERDKKVSQDKMKNEIDVLTKDRDSWATKYTESTIIRAITDSAANNKAIAPKQIVALLRPSNSACRGFR